MKTQKSILQVINRTNFKKYINYKLNERAKLKRFSSFTSKTIIFEVEVKKNNMLFSIDNCRFMSASNYHKNTLKAVFSFKVENLHYIINEVNFFNKFPENKIKSKFPNIELKSKF